MSDDTRRLNEARFTLTAEQYAASQAATRLSQDEALFRLTSPAPDDRALDVACGPGNLLAGLAPRIQHAVGLDATMAMLQEARRRPREGGVLSLVHGAAEHLPFPDGAFSLVVSTSALHHMRDPRVVLAEMARVCRAGGRVAIGDLVGAEDDGRRARQNAIERLRDPGHVELYSPTGLTIMLTSAGLVPTDRVDGEVPRELDEWCRIARTPPDAAEQVRRMLLATQPGDLAGMNVVETGGEVRFRHRWVIIAARKP